MTHQLVEEGLALFTGVNGGGDITSQFDVTRFLDFDLVKNILIKKP